MRPPSRVIMGCIGSVRLRPRLGDPSLSRVGRGGQWLGGVPSETLGGIPVAINGRIFSFFW